MIYSGREKARGKRWEDLLTSLSTVSVVEHFSTRALMIHVCIYIYIYDDDIYIYISSDDGAASFTFTEGGSSVSDKAASDNRN